MDLQRIPGGQVVAAIVTAAAAASMAVVDAVASGLEGVARLVHPCLPAADTSLASPVIAGPPAVLPEDKWFYFRRGWDAATGAVARNLHELETQLQAAGPDVIGHHSWRGDFSHWVADAIGDRDLAGVLSGIEADIRTGVIDGVAGRERLVGALRAAASF
jgi:hypothetical protein